MLSRLAWIAVATVAGGSSFPPGSPQDIVAHARLQALMRQCQQQTRREVRIGPEEEARSREFHATVIECLRDNRAWYPLSR
jgi:hypothetical protein